MHRLAPLSIIILMAFSGNIFSQSPAKKIDLSHKPWPEVVKKVVLDTSDGVGQPTMWYTPPNREQKKPLLVVLHTWGRSYSTAGGDALCAEWCMKNGWAFLHPHFRGPNNTPDAMGSDRAVKDIVEAVAWAKQQTAIDERRVYLIGGSGGAHMSLIMAGRHPELWAAVSAWCGISDIAQWHEDCTKAPQFSKYAKDIEAALGGSPSKNESVRKEAWHRSPLAWLKGAAGVPLDINHGIHDGRTGSVPFVHSIHAFNAVIANDKEAQLSEEQINSFYETRSLPTGWPKAESDAMYDRWTPLFVKTKNNTRLTIFEGGHEVIYQVAFNWLAKQRKGQPAVWNIPNFTTLEICGGESNK